MFISRVQRADQIYPHFFLLLNFVAYLEVPLINSNAPIYYYLYYSCLGPFALMLLPLQYCATAAIHS